MHNIKNQCKLKWFCLGRKRTYWVNNWMKIWDTIVRNINDLYIKYSWKFKFNQLNHFIPNGDDGLLWRDVGFIGVF